MAIEGSVSKNDYREGKKGDRHPMRRPKDSEMFDVKYCF